jgi:hypothetical protein
MKINKNGDSIYIISASYSELSELYRGLCIADHEGQPNNQDINDELRHQIGKEVEIGEKC